MNLFRPRFHDGETLEVAGRRVVLKVNRRARRVSLRVSASGAEVVAVAPSERRLSEAAAFAQERAAWIAARLADQPRGLPFEPGAEIPYRGGRIRIERVPGASAARLVEDEAGVRIVSGGEGPAFVRRIERLLRAEAQKLLLARTEVHVTALGLKIPKVSLADPKSRWGSCTPGRGTIRYSWRLILAPDRVLDYVAAHEVAHLVHADHSPRFWAVVRSLVGDEKAPRRWLRTHGPGLQVVGRL